MKYRITLPDTKEFIGGYEVPAKPKDAFTERVRRHLRREIYDWLDDNVTGRWKYVDAYTYKSFSGKAAIGNGYYCYITKTTKPVLCFGRKADAMLFKLRWL